MKTLIKQIEQWAKEKGIFEHSSPLKQHVKTQEEVNELLEAIVDNNKLEIEDAIGDIIVTLTIQAKMHDLDIENCIQSAYNVISKRQGKMVNGIFEKEE